MSLSKETRSEMLQKLIHAIGDSSKAEPFVVSKFAEEHGVSTQTVYRYLKTLKEDGKITKDKSYELIDTVNLFTYGLEGLSESQVWSKAIKPLLDDLPDMARRNCEYIFTEMLNNAIEHSEGSETRILVQNNGYRVQIIIADNGVGIFQKIADAMQLEEKRFAVLELAKGKFTTNPNSHTGEGVFFSSKAADTFVIHSEGLAFVPLKESQTATGDSILLSIEAGKHTTGTLVGFSVKHDHSVPLADIFKKYTLEPDHYGFTKTLVPVRLLEYGDSCPTFMSRSQARRLLAGFEKFTHIDLDFAGVDEIGQGFADEIFRVFKLNHPNTEIRYSNCNSAVLAMIRHVTHS